MTTTEALSIISIVQNRLDKPLLETLMRMAVCLDILPEREVKAYNVITKEYSKMFA